MLTLRIRGLLLTLAVLGITPVFGFSQTAGSTWTFAVSGDSRNCGDFVMPAIAAKVKAENDSFYWHLGDFRWMTMEDQDLEALRATARPLPLLAYKQSAWDDFFTHQLAAFGAFPVFLGRGNHETVSPMTRDGYIAKFGDYLNRPEILAQRKADGAPATPQPWYHWTRDGVDFINLDNASHEEFSDAQLNWLRSVLDHDLAPRSGIRTIVAGMHEALPHSTSSNHAMDDWELGVRSGEEVYNWFFQAQKAGKIVYILASHSHYYAPNIFSSPYWKQQQKVVPGWIIGAAGAHRYKLPAGTDKESKTDIYGFLRGSVHGDGTIDFTLHQLSEGDLVQSRWPNAPLDAIHECYVANSDDAGR